MIALTCAQGQTMFCLCLYFSPLSPRFLRRSAWNFATWSEMCVIFKIEWQKFISGFRKSEQKQDVANYTKAYVRTISPARTRT